MFQLLAQVLSSTLLLSLTVVRGNGESNCTDNMIRLEAENMSTNNWGNSSFGRLEVCWGEEWKAVLHGSITTTQQLSEICEHLHFLPEGAEMEEMSYDNDSIELVSCRWNISENGTINAMCSQPCNSNCQCADCQCADCQCAGNSINATTMIHCKTFNYFSRERIALIVLLPVLLSLIAVGVIVLAHFAHKVKRLNVIIHQLIYKQQKIRAGLDPASLEGGTSRNSMYGYAKPYKGGSSSGTGAAAAAAAGNDQERRNEAVTVNNETSLASAGGGRPPAGQYSLLGHEKKYENVEMENV